MLSTRIKVVTVSALIVAAGLRPCLAGDRMTITIPMRSRLTPVQQLNREGVKAVRKNQYAKAESLFYKAYLYDPADPFTLNNLGFIAEFEGQLDRAHKLYQLASEQGSNADIDLSNVKRLEGQPMKSAFENLQDMPMRVNRINVNAMRLLSEGRGAEAIQLLKQALVYDPQNPFTLNNLGVAEEQLGDYRSALKYYGEVASLHSTESVVVTPDQAWSGRKVTEMAAANARRLESRMQRAGPRESEAAMYSTRGVLAANQNDWATARQDFLRAYSINPNSAFSLNNRGYVAELDGDLESAQFFYEKARKAGDSNALVGLSTQPLAPGTSLLTLASGSDVKVNGALERYSQVRRQETGPIELTPRGDVGEGNSPAKEELLLSPNVTVEKPSSTISPLPY